MQHHGILQWLVILSTGLAAQDLPVTGWTTAFRDWSEPINHFMATPAKVESAADILNQSKLKLEQGLLQKLAEPEWEKRLILFVQKSTGQEAPVGGMLVRLTQGLNAGAYAGKSRLALLAEANVKGFSLTGGGEVRADRKEGTADLLVLSNLKRRAHLTGPLWSYATLAARWKPDPVRILRLENGISLAVGLEWHFGNNKGHMRPIHGFQGLKNPIRRKPYIR